MGLLIVLCLISCLRSIYALNYVEVFRDDFNGPNIDGTKWNRINAPSQVNSELEFYLPENAFQQDGFAHLRAEKRSYGGRDYTSGRLDTKDKFKLLYGEVEWRAKLPKGMGLWPALWLLQWQCPAAVGCGSHWPPEIDVMEARGDIPNKITTTVHYGKWPNNHYTTLEYYGPDFTADFHNYKVIWDPNQVTFFVDGNQVFKVTDKNMIPTEEQYLIMNLAVGGTYSGNPDGSTKFPADLVVDWVSVHRWQ